MNVIINHVLAFATPNSSNGLSWDSGATSILQRLVKSARNSGKGTKIVLSIGTYDSRIPQFRV